MRKLIKRIAVCVSAFALVAAGIVAGKADAVKAAEIETTAHVIVKGAPEGTDKIGFNIWGGAWVVSEGAFVNLKEATTALSAWNWGDTWVGNIDMTPDANGMYTCTMKFDQAQFDTAAGNCGVQAFVYGAENAAVAADYSTTLHMLLADESVSDIYIIADYTNANGADGGVLTIQKDNPLADNSGDNDNNTPSDEDNNTPSDEDNDTPSDDDTTLGDDVTTGDATSIVMFIAVAAVAAATVVITRKKSVEE